MRGVGILQLLMLLLFCACSEDDQLPENTATVLCSLTSDNRQSLNGRLVFDRAYVHLSGIEVSVYKDNAQEFTSENFDETQQFQFYPVSSTQINYQQNIEGQGIQTQCHFEYFL